MFGRLPDMAVDALEGLRAEGITPTDSEIFALGLVARECEDPQTRITLARGTPVVVRDLVFWPLTIYARDWLVRHASRWPVRWRIRANAYAMAHPDDDLPEVFPRLVVASWWASLRARVSEIDEAVLACWRQDDSPSDWIPVDSGGRGGSWAEFAQTVVAVWGVDPRTAERAVTTTYASAIVRNVVLRRAAGRGETDDDRRARMALCFSALIRRIHERHQREEAARGDA